jgi:hypothetical protein
MSRLKPEGSNLIAMFQLKVMIAATLLMVSISVASEQQPDRNTQMTDNKKEQTNKAEGGSATEPVESKNDQNSAPKDRPFKPTEEVSEDDPIPFPADI